MHIQIKHMRSRKLVRKYHHIRSPFKGIVKNKKATTKARVMITTPEVSGDYSSLSSPVSQAPNFRKVSPACRLYIIIINGLYMQHSSASPRQNPNRVAITPLSKWKPTPPSSVLTVCIGWLTEIEII